MTCISHVSGAVCFQVSTLQVYDFLLLVADIFPSITKNKNKQKKKNAYTPTALKPKSCYDANFVVTGATGGCHNDNLRATSDNNCWHYETFSEAPPSTISLM